ncbi:sensor histidine kinase [Paenibacillus psychroresistens]|nr:sensor histidine kinase [Paenibacillus psychroresistens]
MRGLSKLNIKRSIHAKLLISFIVVIIFSTLATSLWFYNISVNVVEEKVSTSFVDNLTFVGGGVEDQLTSIYELSEYIYVNHDVNKVLTSSYSNDFDYFSDASRVQQVLQDYSLHRHIFSQLSSIIITGNNGKNINFGENSGRIDLEKLRSKPWFEATKKLDGKVLSLGLTENDAGYATFGNKYVFSIARLLKNSELEKSGIVYISFYASFLGDLLKTSSINSKSAITIVDNNGKVAYDTQSLIPMNSEYPALSQIKQEKGSYISTISGKKYLTAYFHIAKFNWWAFQTIPYKELTIDNNAIFTVVAMIFFISIIFTSLIWFFISSSIVRPIKNLTSVIKQYSTHNTLTKIKVSTYDEIGLLGANFNHMIDRIQTLFEDWTDEHTKKKEAEFQALQAQINPHFIYNTLNTIRWIAIIQKSDSIKEIVDRLGSILRNTFKNTNPTVTIGEEIDFIQDYITIQKFRYNDKFDMVVKVDSEILDYQCLKFILQPFIENAIFHGIEPKDGYGRIVLSIQYQEDDLVIFIEDNGVGMNVEETQKARGIGMRNVHQRIQLTYGLNYGVQIESVINEYTQIKITFPALK